MSSATQGASRVLVTPGFCTGQDLFSYKCVLGICNQVNGLLGSAVCFLSSHGFHWALQGGLAGAVPASSSVGCSGAVASL